MLELIESVSKTNHWPYRQTCETVGLSYSSFMRWKERQRLGQAAIQKPGPQKAGILDVDRLEAEIRDLAHRKKRTYGTGELYQAHGDEVSRRELQVMVSMVRQELNREQRAMVRRVSWDCSGLVWSMDDSEYARSADSVKLFLHLVRDLGSRREFDPLTGSLATDDKVADDLCTLFEEHGAPVFLKRDNAKNLNAAAVNEVLAEYGVLPLNSPTYYPPYNGGIERGIRELKELLEEKYGCSGYCPQQLRASAPLAVHDLNHKQRDCLQGKIPCEMFTLGRSALKQYTLQKRKEIHAQLQEMAADIMAKLEDDRADAAQTAWRIAVETWLRRNGLITVTQNGKVLPCL